MKKAPDTTTLSSLLNDERIDRAQQRRVTFYCVLDLIRVLTDTNDPAATWADLKRQDPALAGITKTFERTEPDGTIRHSEFVELGGVLRVVQSVKSRRAETIKRWLAQAGVERLEEARNPERALVRARRLYEHKGYDRPWMNKRLRSVGARHDLTSEWARRGATDGEHYRALTNELMTGAFGRDVQDYRRAKGLSGTASLRDHMTDLELVLTELSEATAAALHKARGSQGIEALMHDAHDAGEIVAGVRREIEKRGATARQLDTAA